MTSSTASLNGRPTTHSHHRLTARCVVVGTTAGALLACGDFGASWLWLPWWSDRLGLGLRLLALEAPAGALGGLLAGALLDASAGAVGRAASLFGPVRGARARAWLRPTPLLLVLAPGLLAVALLLFSGGTMSRLPHRSAWIAVTAIVLLAGTLAGLWAGAALHASATEGSRRRGLRVGGALLFSVFVLSKLDQQLYPNLYEYLHGLLTITAWAVACLALSILIEHVGPLAWARRPRLTAALLLCTAAIGVLAANLATLESNPNVRVALFDARASSSRSLMLGISPVLARAAAAKASADAIERARLARAHRRAHAEAQPAATVREAHVLLITVDALRADHLGLYGGQRGLSPHLDELAADSVVFDHAYAAAPHSSYSLSSLMVSDYLRETVGMALPLPEQTLATAAAKAGYATAAFFTLGIFHTEGERLTPYHDTAFGFARHDHANYDAEARTDSVLAELDRIVADGEPPSILWTHYFDVHEPYEDTSIGTSDVDRYDGEIRHVDQALGRLLEGARAKLHRPLVVVVTADHGEEFRDHGGVYHGSTLYQEQIRVPLVIHVPGIMPRRVAAPVELVDLAPTLLGLLEVEAPTSMRGDDLRPLLTGSATESAPAFASVANKRMVVRWPVKLIADLRFGLFELYDLETDPHERTNLAAERPEEVDALMGEVYAWLDSLEPAREGASPEAVALERGRLGDRRAVEPLIALLENEHASGAARSEAARTLGQLADARAIPALFGASRHGPTRVAAEASVALGRMYDRRAKRALVRLVFSEDPDLRTRAAIALARLRDRRAVPGLIDALYVSTDRFEREEAVRWLGRLGDPRAVEPLIELIPEFRLRYLTVVALGQLGDPRAFGPLTELLSWETHTNVRDNVTRALGQLGDPRAIGYVLPLAVAEPNLKYAPEALVRLDAIAHGAIGGSDVTRGARGQRGLARCEVGPLRHDWAYNARTFCTTRAGSFELQLSVPKSVANAETVIAVLRGRRATDGPPVRVKVRIAGYDLTSFELSRAWRQRRWTLPRGLLHEGNVRVTVELEDPSATLDVDHLLLLPAESAQDS